MIQPEDLEKELSGLPISPEDAAWVRKNFYAKMIAPTIRSLPQDQRAKVIDRWAPKVQGADQGEGGFTTGLRTGLGSTLTGMGLMAGGAVNRPEETPGVLDSARDIATSIGRGNTSGLGAGLAGEAGAAIGMLPMLYEGPVLGKLGIAAEGAAAARGASPIMSKAAGVAAAGMVPGAIGGALQPADTFTQRAKQAAEGAAFGTALGALGSAAVTSRAKAPPDRAAKVPAITLDEAPPAPLTPEELAASRGRGGVSSSFERTGTPEEMARERVVTAEPVPNALEDMSRNLGALREQGVSQALLRDNPPGIKPVPNALEDMNRGLSDMRDRAVNPRALLADSNPIPMPAPDVTPRKGKSLMPPKASWDVPLSEGSWGDSLTPADPVTPTPGMLPRKGKSLMPPKASWDEFLAPTPEYTPEDHAHVTRTLDPNAYTEADHAKVMETLKASASDAVPAERIKMTPDQPKPNASRTFTDLDEAARFIEANPDHDFHQTPSGVTVWPVKARAPKGARSGAVNPAAAAEAAGKAVDATGRGARAVGRAIVKGADAAYDWRASKNLRKMFEIADSTWRNGWRKAVGVTPSEAYTWLQHAPSDLPLAKRVRAYAISRFGLTPEMKQAIVHKAETTATMKHELLRLANHYATKSPEVRAHMYDMLAEPDIGPRSAEAQAIADRIDRISEAKVSGGLLSREAADKHAGHYLKREYAKHAPATQRVVDWFDRISGGGLRGYFRRGGEHTLSPQMWETLQRDWQPTGIDHRVTRGGAGIDPLTGYLVDGKGAKPGNMILTDRATGESISVPDDQVAHYTSNDWTFERWKNREMHAIEAKVSEAQRRLDDAIEKKRSTETIQKHRDALDAATATFLDRAKTEPIIGHRDWSMSERHQMGLKRDVAEALAKMAYGDSENVGRGEFFKEIASHPDWSVDAKTAAADPKAYADWVHMPNEKAPGSGPGSSAVRRWGALSDRYVHPDLAAYVKNIDQFAGPRWFKKVTGVNLWKAFKTKYNPTFYVNQGIQNMTPYLLAGGSPLKLPRAIFDMAQVDPHAHLGGPKTYIQRMEDLGVIRDGQMVADLAEKYGRNSNSFNPLNWSRDLAQTFEKFDRKLSDFGQFGDDVYRVALVRTKMDEGMPFEEAVQLTKDTFYRSEDVTSPLAEHASTVIPFVKYAIYAADKYPKLVLDNPAKGLALLTMWALVKEFNDKMAGVTAEQAKARDSMMPRHLKDGILGPHYMPLPVRDKYGHQRYLDTKNYEMFGGGPFDMGETPSGFIPAAAMPGGPVAVAAGEARGYDWFHDRKLRGSPTDENGNRSYDDRLKFAIDGLSPGVLSYADSLRRTLSDEATSRGTRLDTPAAAASMIGVKMRPFDATAQFLGQQAGQSKEGMDLEQQLNLAIRNLAQNPNNKKMRAEVDRLIEFQQSMWRRQGADTLRGVPALGIDRNVQPKPAPSILDLGPGVNPLRPAPTPDAQTRRLLEKNKGATL